MARKQPFGIVDVLLIVVIIGLTISLWYVIWSPGRQLAFEEDMKWESRARMSALRTAQIEYYHEKETYASDMDTLIHFVRDSLSQQRIDSVFTKQLYLTAFSFDSIRHTPKSLRPYVLAVDDTSALHRYSIVDPDGYGTVSSLLNADDHNRASWEQ